MDVLSSCHSAANKKITVIVVFLKLRGSVIKADFYNELHLSCLWPTVWRRSTLFVYALAGWHHGLTPTVVLLVGTAAVWSVATDGLSTQNIDVHGSTPSARGSGCTGPGKKHIGSVVWNKTDAHFPNYGVHCHCNQLTSKVDRGITGSRLRWSILTYV